MHSENRILIVTLLLAALLFMGAAPSYYGSAEEGREAYKEGRFAESLEHFNDALTDGGDPDVLQYNIGNAKYKTGDYEGAESDYRGALAENGETAGEYYNLGNALAMQAESALTMGDASSAEESFNGAVAAYEKALELDYKDADAIHNLEYVKRRLEDLKEQQQRDEESTQGDESGQGDQESQEQAEGEQQGDESSGESRQDSSEQQDSEGEGQQEEAEQGQPDSSEQQEQDEGQGEAEPDYGDSRPDPSKDGLGYTDDEIESLLDYFEHKERMQEQPGYGLPVQPMDEDWAQGIWDEFFGKPPEKEDDWIDW